MQQFIEKLQLWIGIAWLDFSGLIEALWRHITLPAIAMLTLFGIAAWLLVAIAVTLISKIRSFDPSTLPSLQLTEDRAERGKLKVGSIDQLIPKDQANRPVLIRVYDDEGKPLGPWKRMTLAVTWGNNFPENGVRITQENALELGIPERSEGKTFRFKARKTEWWTPWALWNDPDFSRMVAFRVGMITTFISIVLPPLLDAAFHSVFGQTAAQCGSRTTCGAMAPREQAQDARTNWTVSPASIDGTVIPRTDRAERRE